MAFWPNNLFSLSRVRPLLCPSPLSGNVLSYSSMHHPDTHFGAHYFKMQLSKRLQSEATVTDFTVEFTFSICNTSWSGNTFLLPQIDVWLPPKRKILKKLPPSSSERINITKDGARWVAAVDLDFWLGWLTDCSVNCPPTYEFPCFWGISCKLEMTWRVSLFLFQVCSEGWAPRILQLVWPLSAKQLFGPLVGLYLTHPTSLIPLPPMMVVKG